MSKIILYFDLFRILVYFFSTPTKYLYPSLYPPHPRLSLPILLPHKPCIQYHATLGDIVVPIYSTLDVTGEDVECLWWKKSSKNLRRAFPSRN